MIINRSFRFASALPIVALTLLIGHSSAKPVSESGKTIRTEGSSRAWATDGSKVLPGVKVWLAAVPKEDGKVHTDGSARSWAS